MQCWDIAFLSQLLSAFPNKLIHCWHSYSPLFRATEKPPGYMPVYSKKNLLGFSQPAFAVL
jgi:hypothetical protein